MSNDKTIVRQVTGRAIPLRGDEIDTQFFRSSQGDSSYIDDPYINESGIILLQAKEPLAMVMKGDLRFRQIYDDRLAVIFVPRAPLREGGTPVP